MVSEPPKPSPPHCLNSSAQTPAASVQPSPFLPPLQVQIPTSASAATINLHLRPTSQPSVHKGAAQILHPAQHPAQPLPSPAQLIRPAPQLLHPAQLRLTASAAAAPSSSDSNLCECSHHQPPSQANLAAISPQRRSPDPAPSPAPSPAQPLPSPAQLICPAPAAPPRAAPPTSLTAAQISQPSVHKGAAQILHPAQHLAAAAPLLQQICTP
ncbi:uncharacterized protein LOC130770556 [Actinidia eriantha]|uniref:uncharacterized protein LOC130770556 n=1 Tax=Actinidia eriantha TaxID=165200 RepID=UPI0025888BFB|nr:uncharacterized protein LOC130770556 [Actinidia eriantha]